MSGFSFFKRVLMAFSIFSISFVAMSTEIEIYVNRSGIQTFEPNMFYMLDTSGSMQDLLVQNPTTSRQGIETKRRVMQNTLVELLDIFPGTHRLGLGRYNANYGGAIVYPIRQLADLAEEHPYDNIVTSVDTNYRNTSNSTLNLNSLNTYAQPRHVWSFPASGSAVAFEQGTTTTAVTSARDRFYFWFPNIDLARDDLLEYMALHIRLNETMPQDAVMARIVGGRFEIDTTVIDARGINILNALETGQVGSIDDFFANTANARAVVTNAREASSGVPTTVPTLSRSSEPVFLGLERDNRLNQNEQPAIVIELNQHISTISGGVLASPRGDIAVGPEWPFRSYYTFENRDANRCPSQAQQNQLGTECSDNPSFFDDYSIPRNGILVRVELDFVGSGQSTPFIEYTASSGAISVRPLGPILTAPNDNFPAPDPLDGVQLLNANAPLLYITGHKSVRHRLQELLATNSPRNAFGGNDGTPILESLVELERYWSGKPVNYGLSRAAQETRRPNGEVVTNANRGFARVSHPDALIDNGALNGMVNGCVQHDPWVRDGTNFYNSVACADEVLLGNPIYASPIEACNNTQVLLTDGAPSDNNQAARQYTRDVVEAATGSVNRCDTTTADAGSNWNEGAPLQYECLADLARHMATSDLDSNTAGTQVVNTSVISYALSSSNTQTANAELRAIATAGAGSFFNASQEDDLKQAFADVVTAAVSGAARGQAPVSVVPLSSGDLATRPEIYLAQFEPSTRSSWDGNVKKYVLCLDENSHLLCDQNTINQLIGVDGNAVFTNNAANSSPLTNDIQINPHSRSFWSGIGADPDARNGGSGAQIQSTTTRNIYIGTAAQENLSASSIGTPGVLGISIRSSQNNTFSITNITGNFGNGGAWDRDLAPGFELLCDEANLTYNANTFDTAGDACGDYVINTFINRDPNNTGARWLHSDVIRSAPTAIYYGNDASMNPIYKVVYGSNDGIFHMLNDVNGSEDWGYMPYRFLSNQNEVNGINATATPIDPEADHVFGFNVTPTTLIDNQGNPNIIARADSDRVYTYLALGRGGSGIYALDLTPGIQLSGSGSRVEPKLLWSISGNDQFTATNPNVVVTTGFERLGLTYSQPSLARVRVEGVVQDVVVFGGGYDLTLDNDGERADAQNPALGNAFYVVDATSGKLLYSLSGNNVTDMVHSIPSSIAVIDLNGDNVDDAFYFGDTGGQVWRVDIENISATPALQKVAYGKLAELGGTARENRRRFFEPPEIAPIRDAANRASITRYNYVVIGSGDRINPRDDRLTGDRFYALRDYQVNLLTSIPGTNGLVKSYPQRAGQAASSAITDAGLVDITNAAYDQAVTAPQDFDGWYYRFDATEKLLSPPTIAPVLQGGAVQTSVFINTYVPAQPQAVLCQSSVDVGFTNALNFNLLTALASIPSTSSPTIGSNPGDVKSSRISRVARGFVPGGSGLVQSSNRFGVVAAGGTGISYSGRKTLSRTFWTER